MITMNKEELLSEAKDPKYIPGIYNYCNRWCQRCRFTSRYLNCELAEKQFGDLESADISSEKFWKKFSEVMQLTIHLIEMLENIKLREEKHFPDARAFVRPGFDE
jgi:hypothetical protein